MYYEIMTRFRCIRMALIITSIHIIANKSQNEIPETVHDESSCTQAY
jgi:hypothetical protein